MRSWLDTVEEVVSNYPHFRKPTKVEKFITDFFDDWMEDAKIDQERRIKASRETPIDAEQKSFHGFGNYDEETWEQWLYFADQLSEPEEERNREDRRRDEVEAD